MTGPSPRVVAGTVGLLAAMLLAAWGVRVSAPTVTATEAQILAFAAPGTIVAGERATAFGALALPPGNAWHRLDVCETDGTCRSLAPVRVSSGGGAWLGAAGHIALDRPGTYEVVWRVFVDVGLDTPWTADVVATRVEAVAGDDARR